MGFMTRLRRPGRGKTRQQGLAMVEFALAGPLLALLFAAAIEIGGIFFTYVTISKSVEVGARYMSINASSGIIGNTAMTTAKNLIVYAHPANTTKPIATGFTPANITIACTHGGVAASGGTRCNMDPLTTGLRTITVTATYDYNMFFGSMLKLLSGGAIGPSLTMSASTVKPLIR